MPSMQPKLGVVALALHLLHRPIRCLQALRSPSDAAASDAATLLGARRQGERHLAPGFGDALCGGGQALPDCGQ